MAFLFTKDMAAVWRFYVEVDKIQVGEFTECSGLVIERETETFNEGGVNDRVLVLPGHIKYSNITLKRGIISLDLWDWFQKGIIDGRPELRSITITLGNTNGKEMFEWNVRDAYPVKWTSPTMNTTGNDLAVEEIEIAHHGFEVKKK